MLIRAQSFLLMLTLVLAVSEASFGMSCRARILGEQAELTQMEIARLRNILSEEVGINGSADHLVSQDQTFFTNSIEPEGRISFLKSTSAAWRSAFRLRADAPTPQGDLRSFIALAGPEIAYYLGFRVSVKDSYYIELKVPQVKMLIEKILPLNKALISLGYEPITFMPESTGFVSEKEMIYGSVKNDARLPDTKLRFAFADKDFQLLPHEVGFHLGLLMFPAPVVARARMVNARLIQLIEVLNKTPEFMKITEILLDARSVEMDIGSSVPGVTAADIRINSKMRPYSELHKMLEFPAVQSDAKLIEESLHFLSKPYLSPFEATLQYVHKITGVGADLISNKSGLKKSVTVLDADDSSYNKVTLTKAQKQNLYSKLKTFATQSQSDLTTLPPQSSFANAQQLFKSLQKRQKEIEQAIRLLKP